MQRTRSIVILSSLLVVLLAGCAPNTSFSPQQAVIQHVINMEPPGSVVDSTSVKVHQTIQINGMTMVVLSFNRVMDNRKEQCLYVMEASRSSLGMWRSGSGGGGCGEPVHPEDVDQLPPLMMIGAGMSGGDPMDPGLSHANGFVTWDTVEKVIIIWSDNTIQEATVENGTYFAARVGQFNMLNLQAIDEKGEVIFDQQALINTGP